MDITLDWLGVSTFRVVIDDLVIFLDATATESAVVARGRGSEQDVFGGSMADWLGQGLSMGRFGQRRAREGLWAGLPHEARRPSPTPSHTPNDFGRPCRGPYGHGDSP